jgi:hypothetical protein
MRKDFFKIIFVLITSFFLTQWTAAILFPPNFPKVINFRLRSSLFYLTKFFSQNKPSPVPTLNLSPTEAIPIFISPTAAPVTDSPIPTQKPVVFYPTAINPSPTIRLLPSPSPTPTSSPPSFSCPTNSNQSYRTLSQDPNKKNRVNFDLSTHPDTNLYLRGWKEVSEKKELISRNGNNYGLDSIMPPQISTLYGGIVPQIIKTYRIYEWDFDKNKSAAPQTATPQFPVHMLGLKAYPGQPLLGLKAGRTIDGTNVFLVMYATKNYILLIHAANDVWGPEGPEGYTFYFLDICVDPNLLAKYQQNNVQGRTQLPVIAPGQIFGYAKTNEVKIIVRDTMSFMDTRYKEDWWQWGQ